MTNEEAIKDIEENILPFVGGVSLRMAIKALKRESVLKKIRAEIEQLPTNTQINWNGCCPDIVYPTITYVTKNDLLAIIDKYIEADKEVNE